MRSFVKCIRLLLGLAVALLVGCARPAPPAEPAAAPQLGALGRITQAGVLRVGMTGEQPPLNMVSKRGDLFGLDVALVRVLAQAMGVEVQLVQMPFSELLGALEAGRIDLVVSGMTITPARVQRVAMVGPYFTSGKTLLTRSSEIAATDNAADLYAARLSVAALRGSTSEAFAKRSMPGATLVLTDTPDEAIQKVLDGEVDAMIADRETCEFAVLRMPGEGLLTSEASFTLEPMGIAAPLGQPRLVSLLQTYLDALEQSGGLERMRAVWFEQSGWVAELPPTRPSAP